MVIVSNHCDRCGTCIGVCPSDALTLENQQLRIDPLQCTHCLHCIQACPVDALSEEMDD